MARLINGLIGVGEPKAAGRPAAKKRRGSPRFVEVSRMNPVTTLPGGRRVHWMILDPTEMPAVTAPVPGGLRFAQIAPFLRTLARKHRIVELDIVEVAPSFDSANRISCITAGRLVVNVLGASWSPNGAFRRAASGASIRSRSKPA
jgi:hypothetical protein